MPEGWAWIVGLLILGYLLILFELFIPGGILGILGTGAIAYGVYLAFEQGPLWGALSLVVSAIVVGGGLKWFFSSETGRRLMLSGNEATKWKAPDERLAGLEGKEGVATSTLRPSGVATIEGERIDVVAGDGEYIAAGTPIRVTQVEGSRVVVEPLPQE